MSLLVAWKKVLLFGAFGAVGCLAGWLVGEPYLAAFDAIAKSAGAGQGPTLISTPNVPASAPPPSAEFQKRLAAAKEGGAGTGDVQISLIWFDTNDLDLHCFDPSGFEIYYKQKRSPATGGELDVDRNAGCTVTTAEPVENIYWPAGKAPMGDYRVELDFFQQCDRGPSRSHYEITILQGIDRENFKGTISKEGPDGPRKIIHSFKLKPLIELSVPQELELTAGRALVVPVGLRRQFFQGQVDVKVEQLPPNVTATQLTIPPGETSGELLLKASDTAGSGETRIKFVATGEGVSRSADPKLALRPPPFSLLVTISMGVWTALLAVGLCLALLAGQNKYLGKSLFAPGRVPLALVILGAVVAGFVSGTIGQALYFVFLLIGVAKLGFLIGWVLLGGLLGWGVSFFIPNLDWKKAALAGMGGGLLGAVSFWIMSSIAREWIGRFGGAALLGFCIGLMVAVVEVAFRRAWLEVRFSEREIITVNLGTEPVKVGGDARACTVWARGAAEIALRYWIRDGKVHCEDVPTKREATVANGDTRTAGGVTVVVRTGSTPLPAGSGPSSVPTRPALPAPSARPAPPAALPAPVPVAASQPPRPASPPPAPAPAPSQAKKPQPDYDDGMPMPMSPPPARAGATSILDIDDYRAAAVARPASPPPAAKPTVPAPTTPAAPKPAVPAPASPPPAPVVAKSLAPPAPKPPAPPAARSLAPPAPKLPAVAKSIAPPAPKPPAAGSAPPAAKPSPKAGDPDACPTCGRKVPGKPGTRYCMVCDKTF